MFRALLLTTLVLAAGAPQARADLPSILVVGDSIGAGYGVPVGESWVDLLREQLCTDPPRCRISNASVSGDTTGGGRNRLPQLLERHEPDVVVLELGGNDGLRGYPIESIRANLAAMIEAARGAGARVLLVGMRIPPNYGPVYTERFHGLYAELAAEYRTALVPFLLEGIATEPGMMQTDGIHPTAAAQASMAELVRPALEGLLAAAMP